MPHRPDFIFTNHELCPKENTIPQLYIVLFKFVFINIIKLYVCTFENDCFHTISKTNGKSLLCDVRVRVLSWFI